MKLLTGTKKTEEIASLPMEGNLAEFSHVARKAGGIVQQRITALKIGQRMQDLPEELWHESFRYYLKEDKNRKGGPNLRMIRLDPNRPSLTVTGFIFNKFVHPFEDRFITAREAARLQGFPDNFKFVGTLTSIQRQIGNAVPVQLAKAVADAILAHHQAVSGESSTSLSAISLFSGAGGMDIGIHNAGTPTRAFHTLACVEYDKDCCHTLAQNFAGKSQVIQADISKLSAEELLETCQLQPGELGLLAGGPPCQSFSQAGKQKGTSDPRGTLIFDYLRLVDGLQPKYFILENVSNLKGVDGGELLKAIEAEIETLGYNVSREVLCAADFGTPQLRKRIIFIGSRKELGKVSTPSPTHFPDKSPSLFGKPHVGVGKAFEGLPKLSDIAISVTA